MSIPSIPTPGSPDISTLSFSILYDISGGVPAITLTNLSTVIHANNLKWWYVITAPSGQYIHAGSATSPDANGVAWTTLSIPAGTWPTPFGNPPCGQVEFSPTTPYICTLYVKDSANNTFSLAIEQTITRPNGNTSTSCGNFGKANIGIQVRCTTNDILCVDSTNLTYNNILTPDTKTNQWIMVYPPDLNGNDPANVTVDNSPNALFPASYSSEGYVLFFNEYGTYDMGNGATIKVQYKAQNPKNGAIGIPFGVLCNINLCQLTCQINAFYTRTKPHCGILELPGLADKMSRLNLLLSECIIAISNPLCNIDVQQNIAEIKAITASSGDCNCGCPDNGTNFSYPINPGTSSGGCCPVTANVLDVSTGNAPALCPGSYFPVQVLGPVLTSPPDILGTAYNINDLVSILNNSPEWQVYGTAFAEGNCKVGWFKATGVTVVPDINVIIIGTTPVLPIDVNVIDKNTGIAPSTCPLSYFPVYVYEPDGTTLIGNANSITELLALINASTLWNAYGVASYNGSQCSVTFTPNDGVTSIPDIKVSSSSGCVGGTRNIGITITDPCGGALVLTLASFPCNLNVDWGDGSGMHSLGNATSKANLVALLNADPLKPSVVTVVDNPAVASGVILNMSDCTYTDTPTIYCDLGSGNVLLYGPNQGSLINVKNGFASDIGVAAGTATRLGIIPTPVNPHVRWHAMKIGNLLLDTEGDTGKIHIYDVTNPLTPSLINTISLSNVAGTNFSGNPHSPYTVTTIPSLYPSYYGLHFVTDFTGAMTTGNIYIVESITGSIWQIDAYSGEVDAFQDNLLLGKCPRCFINGIIYFTQDGDIEDWTAGSGVASGDIVTLDTATFSAGGLDTITIFLNNLQKVWCASYDGIDKIYFGGTDVNGSSGAGGSLAIYSISSAAVTVRKLHICPDGNWLRRANCVYYAGNLYITPFGKADQSYPTFFVAVSDIPNPTPTFTKFNAWPGVIDTYFFNFKPIGNCYGIVTSSRGNVNTTTYVGLYKLDGTFINWGALGDTEAMYNVVPFGNITSFTPNGLV